MQQMILLEKSDLEVIKGGGTLTINAGAAVVTIGYAGKMTIAKNGTQPKLAKTGNGTKYWDKDYVPKIARSIQCAYCPQKLAPQGVAKHVDWHQRQGDKRLRRPAKGGR